MLEKIKQKTWVLKTLFTGEGTISLVEFLASTQKVFGGRACITFGPMNSREFEETSETIEVPK